MKDNVFHLIEERALARINKDFLKVWLLRALHSWMWARKKSRGLLFQLNKKSRHNPLQLNGGQPYSRSNSILSTEVRFRFLNFLFETIKILYKFSSRC